jgi:hypothetical protein
MLVPNNLYAIIQKHRAKKLTSLCETSRRHLDRYVWFEDKTKIILLAPHDSTTGMRAWIAQGDKEQR